MAHHKEIIMGVDIGIQTFNEELYLELTALSCTKRIVELSKEEVLKYLPFDICETKSRLKKIEKQFFYEFPPIPNVEILLSLVGQRWSNLWIRIEALNFEFVPDNRTIYTPKMIKNYLLPIYKHAVEGNNDYEELYKFMLSLVENNCVLYPC